MTQAIRPYRDRRAAGDALAHALRHYAGRQDVVVLGLPRGGVPVAARVAAALGASLDVLIVRKLGLPSQPELAMGAVAAVGDSIDMVRNDRVLVRADVDAGEFESVLRGEVEELRRRERAYRGGRPAAEVRGRTVIVVDDGLATGSTMRAAIAVLRRQDPARIVVAVPIGAPETCAALRSLADEVVCPWQPPHFSAVGQGYLDFTPTDDAEVRELLS